ncbi:MAG TPA: RIP metalloprotease RseP, partial [Lachnospiraceae bacterium]|nr:RIP metalloprotease RseP [Lachnospiraceae bacterium]
MSGPVGIVKTVGDAYEEAQPEGFLITFMTVLNVLCLITVNVG